MKTRKEIRAQIQKDQAATKTYLDQPAKVQANWRARYESRKHTEDCMDANDDTSVFKGKCICVMSDAEVLRANIDAVDGPRSQPTHTPTPWHVNYHEIVAANHTRPCHMSTSLNMFAPGESEANAAFIVRAVNCHQELIDTLKDLAHYCHDQIDETGLQERVRQAIAKAEGK